MRTWEQKERSWELLIVWDPPGLDKEGTVQILLLQTQPRSCCYSLSSCAEKSMSCSAWQPWNILLHNTEGSTCHKAMPQVIVSLFVSHANMGITKICFFFFFFLVYQHSQHLYKGLFDFLLPCKLLLYFPQVVFQMYLLQELFCVFPHLKFGR